MRWEVCLIAIAVAMVSVSATSQIAMARDTQGQQNNLIGILTTYAQTDIKSHYAEVACKQVVDARSAEYATAQFKQADYMGASVAFLAYARDVATCAVGPTLGGFRFTRIPLATAFDESGQTLAMSVLAARLGEAVIPATRVQARDALALLNNNPAGNAELIAKLKASGLVDEPVPTTSPTKHVIAFTAKTAVAAYKNNNFAFNSKYDGKILTISGVVHLISGSGQKATVTMLGFTPVNLKNLGFQDEIRCEVSDTESLSKVMNLSAGQSTKVTGLYSPSTQALQVGIELQRCQVD